MAQLGEKTVREMIRAAEAAGGGRRRCRERSGRRERQRLGRPPRWRGGGAGLGRCARGRGAAAAGGVSAPALGAGVGGRSQDGARRRGPAPCAPLRGGGGAAKAGAGLGVSQPLRLVVHPRVHAEELRRFESQIVRGPGPADCAIWTGAIGGDGYGRFWVRRGLGERIMVRANRYALAAAREGRALEPWVRALHGCDNPVCVRVSRRAEGGLLHVVGGSQRDNMEQMARAGRGGGRPAVRRGVAGLAQRRARAVALRDAVRGGWDPAAVADALVALREPTLW